MSVFEVVALRWVVEVIILLQIYFSMAALFFNSRGLCDYDKSKFN